MWIQFTDVPRHSRKGRKLDVIAYLDMYVIMGMGGLSFVCWMRIDVCCGPHVRADRALEGLTSKYKSYYLAVAYVGGSG